MKGHWCSMQYPYEWVYIHIDYMITLLLSLFSQCALCVCVWLQSWPSHLCVNVGRVDQYKKEKTGKKKKFRSSATAQILSAFKSLGDWCVECVCMLSLDIGDRKALDEVKKRKERKPRQTSKARLQQVSPSCTRAPPAFDLSLSLCLSSLVLVESSLFLSPSAHVDLIYTDYFTITIDHSRVERERARRERARVAHTKGQHSRSGNKDDQRMSKTRTQFLLHHRHYGRRSVY